jgi:glycosyltransferase involved in cell wall biosynthesis
MPGRAGRRQRAESGRRDPIVAIVIDAVFPYHLGGREVRYHELARRLTAEASIHIYTMNWWQGPRTIVDDDVTYHAVTGLHPLYTHGRRSIKQATFFALGCLRLLWCRFDVLNADHIPYFQLLVLRIIASLKRKPFVVTWHEVWGRDAWREYLGRAGLGAWLIEWLAMRLPDHIMAASPQTADRLRAILGDRADITIAPNGLDLELIHGTEPDPAAADIVVVGRLVSHKRVDMLLDAVAQLHAEGVPVTCRVIGDGPERAALLEYTEASGLSDAVEFRHDVREQREVYALVKAARVAVFPSAREGFGAAVLEAVACDVPVVTTSAPDNLSRHLVSRASRGYICEPSAAALAETLRPLLGEPQPESGPDEWLDEYRWENVTSQIARALGLRTPSSLNIAIFVHYTPPHIGGIEVVASRQARSLAAAGENVTMITSACGAAPGLTGPPNYRVRRVRAWNYFEERWHAVFPIFAPSLIWHSFRAVRRADVVHAHDSFYLTSLAAALWARVLSKPLILTQHVDMVPHPNQLIMLVQRIIYSTTGKFIRRSSRQVIVLNSRVADFVAGKGVRESEIKFLPNGVDAGQFSPTTEQEKAALRARHGLPQDKVLALFVGRFVPKKGFEKLFELSPIENLELVFVGGQAPPGYSRDDQHFLGIIDPEDMPDIYRLCDVFVLPSEGEGFPATAQEAMASGLAVIMTDDPAYEMYHLDRSLVKLVDPNVESIGAALRSTVGDPELRQAMAAYSRLYTLKNFELASNVADLISIYRKHVASSP